MSTEEESRQRSESVSSESMDDIELFPLTDFDSSSTHSLNKDESDEKEEDDDEPAFKPLMSLRQRRHSRLFIEQTPMTKLKIDLNNKNNKVRAATDNQDIPKKDGGPAAKKSMWESPKIKGLWKRALKKAKSIEDPWEKFHIDELPTEDVIRHRYSSTRKKWVEDECQVKMEKQAFNHGAMRACYRLKKLSSFSHKKEWHHAMNYVAKLYMEDVDRDVYFEDVKLQMDAKLWGEEYNRHNPPKKVDIFQMCILEFKDRPGKPLYHLEHFIEGDYIKYNSNSGFVEENLRYTPQAFSHFTFERSGHQVIVVDIQGVGDLWTDPQVHTSEGEGYGDGNLGTRGMALFFHSHICNPICRSLGLTKFDLSPNEVRLQEQFIQATQSPEGSVTMARGKEQMCHSASPLESVDLVSFLAARSRTTSTCSQISEATSELSTTSEEPEHSSPMVLGSPIDDVDLSPDALTTPETPCSPAPLKRTSRVRFISECDSTPSSIAGSCTFSEEEDKFHFNRMAGSMPRPSSISAEIQKLAMNNSGIGDSVLGEVHHDLAKYHELGRFTIDDNDKDMESAFFHEQQAASLGIMEAIKCMAHIYLGIPREILVNYEVEDNELNRCKGIDFMYMAAKAGSRSAMIHMARAYETGLGLGAGRQIDWEESVSWYQKAIDTEEADDSGEYDGTLETPVYQMQAKVADMYLSGGPLLEADPSYAGEMYTSAADSAMAAMKGRMANKYYALAEEAWGQVEE